MHTRFVKLSYWIAVILFCIMMAYSGFMYLASSGFRVQFAHLGFPPFFQVELAILKLAGVFVLLVRVSKRLKEWAYAGFLFNLLTAVLAHLMIADGLKGVVEPASVAFILTVVYLTDSQVQAGGLRRPIRLSAEAGVFRK